MSRIVVGSGWWCSEAPDAAVNPNRKKAGDDLVRGVSFFELWLRTVRRVSNPGEIVVADSCSPVKPPNELRRDVTWLELPFNAKHSTDHIGRWSGWLRSVLLGGSHAICSEADYFVYVEQDCLLSGDNIVEHCISHMKRGLMFGSGRGTPQPIQQSFFIVRSDRLPAFLKNLVDLKDRDCELDPEWKFIFASWRPFVIASNLGLIRSPRIRRWVLRIAQRLSFEWLPVHGGRSRPLNMSATHFYFQQGTADEIQEFITRSECN